MGLLGQVQDLRTQVHGFVTELGTNQPVADATVKLWLRANPAPKVLINGGFTGVDLTTQTGHDGSFSFEIEGEGVIRVQAIKEGFRGAAMFESTFDQATLTLDKDHAVRDVSLHLTRPGSITGRVIDEETRKPVAHVKLGAFQANYQGGLRGFIPAGAVGESDGEGRFTLRNLPATDVVVAVRPHSIDDGRVLSHFEAADFEKIDSDFERTWWPGGRDEETAFPIPLGSGQIFDIGQIAVRKAPLYRAKVTLASASCAPGELVQVSQVVRHGFFNSQGNSTAVPCGEPFLITRLAPGAYWVEARSEKRPLATLERASVPFEIRDKNVEVKSLLSRGVDIDLSIVPTEGSRKADWSAVRVMMMPRGRASRIMSELPGSPGEDGRLHLVNVDVREYQLRFSGLPAGFYVKEVRYNGAVMPFATLTVTGAAMAHKIEVAVDDKPATLTGETKPGSQVVLAMWPIRTPDPRTSLIHRRGGEDGKYQFVNVAPGEYRIFAIHDATASQLNRPGVLDRMLQSAKKVTLSPASSGTENLDPLTP